MNSLLIEGGRPLSGEVVIAGNKNAALPMLAATWEPVSRRRRSIAPAVG